MNFISNDPDEIKKEKEKNAALHSLFPLTMGGSEDKTNYYLVDDGRSDKDSIYEKNDTQFGDVCNTVNSCRKVELPKLEKIENPEEPIKLYDRPSRTNRRVRTVGFALREPSKAMDIGQYVRNSTNISTNATRFSTGKNVLYGVTLTDDEGNVVRKEEERGSEKGAFRHTIWQAKIASKYGKGIAKQVGNAHEDNPRVNLYQRSFGDIDEADQTVDLLNNMIGRRIGETCRTGSMRDMAFMILDEFRYNGLYTAEPDERGIWHVKKRRLSQEKYDILKEHYKRVDENGYTPEELRQAQIDEKNESKISKIWKLIKSLSGY